MLTDTPTAVKLEQLVTNKYLLKDIRNLSGEHQTSGVEAFHSLIVHYAPKMTVFGYAAMLARLVPLYLDIL